MLGSEKKNCITTNNIKNWKKQKTVSNFEKPRWVYSNDRILLKIENMFCLAWNLYFYHIPRAIFNQKLNDLKFKTTKFVIQKEVIADANGWCLKLNTWNYFEFYYQCSEKRSKSNVSHFSSQDKWEIFCFPFYFFIKVGNIFFKSIKWMSQNHLIRYNM